MLPCKTDSCKQRDLSKSSRVHNQPLLTCLLILFARSSLKFICIEERGAPCKHSLEWNTNCDCSLVHLLGKYSTCGSQCFCFQLHSFSHCGPPTQLLVPQRSLASCYLQTLTSRITNVCCPVGFHYSDAAMFPDLSWVTLVLIHCHHKQ